MPKLRILSEGVQADLSNSQNTTFNEASACSDKAINFIPGAEEPKVFGEKNFAGNVLLVTLGCAKNLVDSEVMLGAFQRKGFRVVVTPESADLIVVNTCAFLESAVKEGVNKILEMAEYKRSGRCRSLIVAGCMVERYREDLKKSLPEVDRFVSTDELISVADEQTPEGQEETFQESRRPYFIYDETMPRVRSTGGYSAYVKVSEGCDRHCAFCIIPKIRGDFRSRSIESVLNEVTSLYEEGVKEVNFIAQDLTAYGKDWPENSKTLFKDQKNLIKLLNAVSNRLDKLGAKNFWMRLLYAYPIGVDEELVRTIVQSPYICNYLDLPLQHISDTVLKRMNRPLGEKNTRALIENIKKVAPELHLRTTFIVGFPGETDQDIESLEQFVAQDLFTHVGTFTYSQEQEAKSYSYPDQISSRIKKVRQKRIMEIQQRNVFRRNQGIIGKEFLTLLEGTRGDSPDLFTARTEWQAPETDGEIIISKISSNITSEPEFGRSLVGNFVKVRVKEVLDYDLLGEIVS